MIMLLLDDIRTSEDITAEVEACTQDEITRETVERTTEAAHIVENFLSSVVSNTIEDHSPECTYTYQVEDLYHGKDISVLVDQILYHSFNKNMNAVPDTFYVAADSENPYDKVIIDATVTNRYIGVMDKRINMELANLINQNARVLKTGQPIIYTGFEKVIHALPAEYVKSRIDRIISELLTKGYMVDWNSVGNYLSVSIK